MRSEIEMILEETVGIQRDSINHMERIIKAQKESMGYLRSTIEILEGHIRVLEAMQFRNWFKKDGLIMSLLRKA